MSSAELADRLSTIDTPTICNAMELVAPGRRTAGFNRQPLICPFPDHKPIVGYSRTTRIAYYEYVETGPRPSITVIHDIDATDRGIGAFWGEVQTNVHQALGCLGVVTDGSVRDIDQMAKGFFVLAGSIMPSHVYADIVDFDRP